MPVATNVRALNVTFTVAGKYIFSLKVANSSGASDTASVAVWVPSLDRLPSPQSPCFVGSPCDLSSSWSWLPAAVAAPAPLGGTFNSSLSLLMTEDGTVVPLQFLSSTVSFTPRSADTHSGSAVVSATWNIPDNFESHGRYTPLLALALTGVDMQGRSIDAARLVITGPVLTISQQFQYRAGEWGACSRTCDAGTRSRSLTCVRGSVNDTVPSRLCLTLPQPVVEEDCYAAPCRDVGWRPSAWSTCSAACGPGVRTRSHACVSRAGAIVLASQCTDAEPATTQPCFQRACDVYTWQATGWGACMNPATRSEREAPACGIGLQERAVQCVEAWTSRVVDGALCDPSKKDVLATSRSCSLQGSDWSCALSALVWSPPWGQCDVACGGGVSKRYPECWRPEARISQTMANCDALRSGGGSTPEEEARPCNTAMCPGSAVAWHAGPWSTCEPLSSVPRGTQSMCGGMQRRRVSCRSIIGDAELQPSVCVAARLRRPIEEQPCGSCNVCYPLHSFDTAGATACSGHGTCSDSRCICAAGWAGATCDTPEPCARRGGAVDRHGSCCATVLNRWGDCCGGAAAVLDARGDCCASGYVDVCGTCNGNATVVDHVGTCCNGQLDSGGLCCAAPLELDSCGVCGGFGNCELQLRLEIMGSPQLLQQVVVRRRRRRRGVLHVRCSWPRMTW
jgi:hypothetical protein